MGGPLTEGLLCVNKSAGSSSNMVSKIDAMEKAYDKKFKVICDAIRKLMGKPISRTLHVRGFTATLQALALEMICPGARGVPFAHSEDSFGVKRKACPGESTSVWRFDRAFR